SRQSLKGINSGSVSLQVGQERSQVKVLKRIHHLKMGTLKATRLSVASESLNVLLQLNTGAFYNRTKQLGATRGMSSRRKRVVCTVTDCPLLRIRLRRQWRAPDSSSGSV